MKESYFFLFLCIFEIATSLSNVWAIDTKTALICGVCKNVEHALPFEIRNIEQLGAQFDAYRVIIYENNSTDGTKEKLLNWQNSNQNVIIISETLNDEQLREGVLAFSWNHQPSRLELLAKARNHLLEHIKATEFDSFSYVIMTDLDFKCNWPINEILDVITSDRNWDCVSANGVMTNGMYYDRLAFRSENFPFGPEVLGEEWWNEVKNDSVKFTGNQWIPVKSAFGGLAIYKRNSIIVSHYSGHVTDVLREDYINTLLSLRSDHPHFIKYCKIHNLSCNISRKELPMIFIPNSGFVYNPPVAVCCDHVHLHASMRLQGFDKIFIDPKMIMHYE